MFRTRIVAIAILGAASLMPSLASAGGRTFKLDTVVKKSPVGLRHGEKSITIRTPIGFVATSISRSIGGSTGTFAPIASRPGKNRTQLWTATPGRYYVSPNNTGFEVQLRNFGQGPGQDGPMIHPPAPGVELPVATTLPLPGPYSGPALTRPIPTDPFEVFATILPVE